MTKKQREQRTKRNIIIFISIAILLEIFLILGNTGFFGKAVSLVFFKIAGITSFILFPLLAFTGIIYLWKRKDKNNKWLVNLLWSFALFFVLMMLIDFYQNKGMTFSVRIENALYLAGQKRGSGVIGASITLLFMKLFGNVGIYLTAFLVIFFALLSFFNIQVKEFFVSVFLIFQKAFQWTKEKFQESHEKRKKRKLEGESFKKTERPKRKKRPRKTLKDTENLKNEERRVPSIKDYKEGSIEQLEIELKDNLSSNYVYPPLELLKEVEEQGAESREAMVRKAMIIEDTLGSFDIQAKVEAIHRGPQVTSYELKPKAGVKVSRIVNLQDDLALALASNEIRIQAPIPGKAAVGIEVPNDQRDVVGLKEIIHTKNFQEMDSFLPFALGKSIHGDPVISSIDKMPHLLIAGATGSGKSVCINTIILSILYKSPPEEVKMILIDPKIVELSVYNKIPHLAIPVVTDPKRASHALSWAVSEMERRYQIFKEFQVRDIRSYNKKYKELTNEENTMEKLPYIVIIIDELSDLMMIAHQEVEDSITRLAQMARACGIHLVIATQRPTVDVITGTIKANIPSRISFAVSSQIDSRTILDRSGAETLLGQGDMLFYPSNVPEPIRIQGAFVSDGEVENIVQAIRKKNDSDYNEEIIENLKEQEEHRNSLESEDSLFEDAVETILSEGTASISLLQRRLKIGYARAGRLIDEMEEQGIVGGHRGSKPREILVPRDFLESGDDLDEYSE